MYGLHYHESVQAEVFLDEGEQIQLGNEHLRVLFTPGHSPGSISFYSKENNFVVSGDVLFNLSIGRTDLPGGHHETLLNSIRNNLFVLPGNTTVYSGHGEETSIGFEKENNPFFRN
jgi:glyoxylase-like metal-dependent hydrolase (beta-lactamase superfamily II)